MKLNCEFDIVNQNIWETYELWEKLKVELRAQQPENYPYLTYHFTRFRKLQEYVIFDLKHAIDEIIATGALLKGLTNSGCIQIGSIGDYLRNQKLPIKSKTPKGEQRLDYVNFDDHLEYLQTINDLCNSYKHSYRHSQTSDFDFDTNSFISIYRPGSNHSSKTKSLWVSMESVIVGFNNFYSFAMLHLGMIAGNQNNRLLD